MDAQDGKTIEVLEELRRLPDGTVLRTLRGEDGQIIWGPKPYPVVVMPARREGLLASLGLDF